MARRAEDTGLSRRVLRRIGWAAAFTVVGLFAVLLLGYVAVNTGAGHRWLTGGVNRHFAPELLPGSRIGGLDGSVPFSFTVRDITVDQPSRGLSAHVEAAHVTTELLDLVTGTVRLSSVDVENPVVKVGPPQPVPPSPGVGVKEPPSPFEVAVEQLTVTGGRVELARAGLEASLEQVSLRAEGYRDADDGVLTMSVPRFAARVSVAGEQVAASADGFLVAFEDRVNGRITVQAGTEPPSRVTARALGPLEAFDVSIEGQGPHLSRFEAEALVDVPQRRWNAQVDLGGDAVALKASGNGTGTVFDAQLQASAMSLGPVEVNGRQVAADGEVQLEVHREASGKVQADGSLEVQHARYADVTVASLGGELSAAATPAERTGHLRLELDEPFEVNGVAVAPTTARVESDGREVSANLSTALMQAGESMKPLRAEARLPLADEGLALARERPLSAHLEWTDVSTAALSRVLGLEPPVQGRLTVRADAEGTLASPVVNASVSADRVAVAGRRGLFARAQLESGERTRFELRAGAGGDVLVRADGSVEQGLGDALSSDAWLEAPLSAQLEVPRASLRKLARLQPALGALEGHAWAKVSVTGTAAEPRLSGALRASAGRPGGELAALALDLDGRVEDGSSRLGFDGRLAQAKVSGELGSALTPAELVGGEAGRPNVWARAEVDGLQLRDVSRLSPALPPLEGEVDATLSGSRLFTAPRARVSLDGANVAIASRAPGQLRLSAHVDEASLAANGRYDQAAGGARFEARLDRQGDAHARLSASRLDLGGLRRYRPKLPLARDEVSGTVTVEGTVAASKAGKSPMARLTGTGEVKGTITAEQLDVAAYLARQPRQPSPQKSTPASSRASDTKALVRELRQARAFHLERLAVKDSRVALVDATQPRRPALNLGDVAFTLENLASGREAMRGVPVVVTARAKVEGSGEVVAFATADPFAEPLVATGRATLKQLELSSVRELLRGYGVVASEGTFSCYASLRLEGDRLDGGIKPVFTDVDIDPAPSASWGEAALAELADFAGDVLAREGPEGRGRVASIVPVKGELGVAGPQVVPAMLTALRNAFVVGLSRGFTNLPLDTAESSQSLFTQAAQALQEDRFPKAQPRGDGP